MAVDVEQLHRRREELRAQGYVVCSSQLYFPRGTKLGWTGGLASYSTADLEAELKRRQARTPIAAEEFGADPL
jgi:hypothetical protein